MEGLEKQTAKETLLEILSQKKSTVKVSERLLSLITKAESSINAIAQLNREFVLQKAEMADQALEEGNILGPLHGLPIVVTDALLTKDFISSAGFEARRNYQPRINATVIDRLLSAGAIILAKSNCSKDDLHPITENELYGRTDNPYNEKHTVGRNGAVAAMIASADSLVGITSDLYGGICQPAHFCGITTINTSNARIPKTGHIPLPTGSLDYLKIAPCAQSVEDIILTLPILFGPDNHDPGCLPLQWNDPMEIQPRTLRIAMNTSPTDAQEAQETIRLYFSLEEKIKNQNFVVKTIDLEELEQVFEIFIDLRSVKKDYDKKKLTPLEETPIDISYEILLDYNRNNYELLKNKRPRKALSSMQFYLLQKKIALFQSKLLTKLKDVDILLLPCTSSSAFSYKELEDKNWNQKQYDSYTLPFSILGWPAITIPIGADKKGLPIGMQIVSKPGHDATALAFALFLEKKIIH
jgi:amidase